MVEKAQKSSEDANSKLREALAAQKRAEKNQEKWVDVVEKMKSEFDEIESAHRKANQELFASNVKLENEVKKVVSENKELLMKVEALSKLVDDEEYDKLTDCVEERDLKMWECIKIDETLVENNDDGMKIKKKALLGKIGGLLKKGSGDDHN